MIWVVFNKIRIMAAPRLSDGDFGEGYQNPEIARFTDLLDTRDRIDILCQLFRRGMFSGFQLGDSLADYVRQSAESYESNFEYAVFFDELPAETQAEIVGVEDLTQGFDPSFMHAIRKNLSDLGISPQK